MSKNEIVKYDASCEAFDAALEKWQGLSTALDLTPARRMFRLADAMVQLDRALTPEVMSTIMQLQGKRVGFKTDKDSEGGYSEDVVKEVTKEAILYGAYMTGNEVNIIAGNMYATKEHFLRKVKELPGMDGPEVTMTQAVVQDGMAKIRCKAKWRINGVEQSLGMDDSAPLTFNVRVYDRKGGHSVASDIAVGKVTRKLYKMIYEKATNSRVSIPDGDSDDIREVPAREVETTKIDISSFKEGDIKNHKPVDEPFKPIIGKGNIFDRDKALSILSNMYDERNEEIDRALIDEGLPILIDIDKNTLDKKTIDVVISIAKIMGGWK